jgi:hypothetical protein
MVKTNIMLKFTYICRSYWKSLDNAVMLCCMSLFHTRFLGAEEVELRCFDVTVGR